MKYIYLNFNLLRFQHRYVCASSRYHRPIAPSGAPITFIAIFENESTRWIPYTHTLVCAPRTHTHTTSTRPSDGSASWAHAAFSFLSVPPTCNKFTINSMWERTIGYHSSFISVCFVWRIIPSGSHLEVRIVLNLSSTSGQQGTIDNEFNI